MRNCEVRDLGRLSWPAAWDLQRQLVEQRKQGSIRDQLLLVEHPHTITLGRNGHESNLLAGAGILDRAGITYVETNRGGDITYHGPGQVVGYPILDLNFWKRDVHEYVRAIEQVQIDALAEFGVAGERLEGSTGVWVRTPQGLAKIGAIGVHISRWVTSHGFAFNVETDLEYFRYIVPCGLTRPVTSLRALGVPATIEQVKHSLVTAFGRVFSYDAVESLAEALVE